MKHIKLFEEYIGGKHYSNYGIKTMDELLDKISKQGIDSLTDEEKERLSQFDTLSQPEPEQKEINKTEEIDTVSNINKKYYDKTKEIGFILKEISDDDKEVYYSGTLFFRGVQYNGYFSKDKKTDAPFYSFISSDGKEFHPADYDLHYEFDDMIQEIFYDENHNQNDNDDNEDDNLSLN